MSTQMYKIVLARPTRFGRRFINLTLLGVEEDECYFKPQLCGTTGSGFAWFKQMQMARYAERAHELFEDIQATSTSYSTLEGAVLGLMDKTAEIPDFDYVYRSKFFAVAVIFKIEDNRITEAYPITKRMIEDDDEIFYVSYAPPVEIPEKYLSSEDENTMSSC